MVHLESIVVGSCCQSPTMSGDFLLHDTHYNRTYVYIASKIARAHRCRNSTPERVSVDREAR
ncbi:hypothetical protein BDV30DRAFT_218757 [Aspergillus minisclerotigenes]|uniref:Uncharacterized protein n=1 Tax=Aspergillus minisclerotigenes TaxID=656917 RepID=A0A5N6INA8_9EURO|nr:hypothetical protein BDV30DRAFT_218757 [Aspergillus minisclerotigenes]